jgi:hypothetical protein
MMREQVWTVTAAYKRITFMICIRGENEMWVHQFRNCVHLCVIVSAGYYISISTVSYYCLFLVEGPGATSDDELISSSILLCLCRIGCRVVFR